VVDYNQPCSDSLNIIDSFSRIVAFKKDISESGLVPSSTLYPSATRVPLTPIAFYDVCTNSPCKNSSDSFTSTDVIGPYTIVKGLQDSVSVFDTVMKAFIKSLIETGDVPTDSLYPSFNLYPEGGININDAVGSGFFRLLSDSFIINDIINSFNIGKYSSESVSISDLTMKAIGKYLGEVGTLPEVALYPANDFYPEGGISVIDITTFGFFRFLSDSFSIDDIDGINFGIGKGLDEDISIFDIILYNIGLYLEENTHILDGISKDTYKLLDDTFTIEDNIVKDITQLLSESMIVDDEIETILRTLVRATLRAIKSGGSSLRAI
jgi:hypothetical protein